MQDDGTILVGKAPLKDGTLKSEGLTLRLANRHGLVAGDPAVRDIEARLAEQPDIAVPAITLDGGDDGVMSVGGTASHAHHFTGRHEHRVVPGAGHNPPQEKPRAFADAVLDVIAPAPLSTAP